MLYEKDGMSFRPVTSADLPKLATHRNDFETYINLTSVTPVWPHKQEKWLESLGDHDYYFIITTKAFNGWNNGIGLARVTEIDWVNRNACIGIDIFKQFRGQGYGTKSFALLRDYCFEVLNLHRLWLLVSEQNIPAIKIYESAGFLPEGRLKEHLYRNEYIDYLLYGLVKTQPVAGRGNLVDQSAEEQVWRV